MNDQRSPAMFTYPSVHDVGIDAVLQSNSSNGRAGLRACLDNLQLEFRTVEPALGDFGGASFARHGVHDVHRAHYLNLFAVLQDGMPSRLRASGLNLIAAAIVLWNTVYLERATNALRGHAKPVDDALLQYLSPLGWAHISLTGGLAVEKQCQGRCRQVHAATANAACLTYAVICFLKWPQLLLPPRRPVWG